MFVSTAYAQGAGGAGGGGLEALLPLILIFVVFYFLLIRPQQKKMKQHREMLSTMRRGDKVVTGGGIIGTVSKVDNEHEVTVEISKDVKVKVRRDLISMVLSKTEPVAGQPPQAANEDRPQSLLGKLFGGGAKPAPAANQPQPEVKPEAQPAKNEKAEQPAEQPTGGESGTGDSSTQPEKKAD